MSCLLIKQWLFYSTYLLDSKSIVENTSYAKHTRNLNSKPSKSTSTKTVGESLFLRDHHFNTNKENYEPYKNEENNEISDYIQTITRNNVDLYKDENGQ